MPNDALDMTQGRRPALQPARLHEAVPPPLLARRFKEAEQAFEKAIRSNEPGSMALADRLSATRGVVEQLVETFNTSDEPQSYVDAFDRFSTWISNSLDVHKVSAIMTQAYITDRR